MPGEYGTRHKDSNFETVSSIGAHFYNRGSGALDLFRQTTYYESGFMHDCQVHRPILRQPQHQLTPITSPWPFYKRGIDIAGPFPVAGGGLKFLIVAIDYFT
nr:reverse transcriptase domain-containing protein [Tanacetum cinerariifolium]